MAAKNKPNELYLTRIYDAPVDLVWDAWTDPKQAAQWWGPRGFTITTHSKELRAGGRWVYTMHGPDGVDYPNIATYHEVEKNTRLVYDHGATETTPPLFKVTVEFSEQNGKTKMEMTMTLATPEAAQEIKKFIKQANGNSTWDRLAEYLEKNASNTEVFVINRSFAAPIDLMFDLWSKPEHIAKWLAPTGSNMEFMKVDIRKGGSSFYKMSNEQGITLYGQAHYLELDRPNLLIYTQHFCDANGNVSRHPLAPTWPESMTTVVRFSSEGPSETRITVTWTPSKNSSSEELATFVQSRAGMTMGWTGSFDKLETWIEQISSAK